MGLRGELEMGFFDEMAEISCGDRSKKPKFAKTPPTLVLIHHPPSKAYRGAILFLSSLLAM